MQKYNLFYNEAILSVIIYDKDQINNLRSKGNIIYEVLLSLDNQIEKFLHDKEDVQIYCLLENESMLFDKLTAYFRFQKTAGGIIYNAAGNILVMSRYGCYDFPKGHIEEGESTEEAAVREVREETGLKSVLLREKIGATYHAFYAHDRYYLKKNNWFMMLSLQNETLIPQKEEHIDALYWFTPEEIKNNLSSFYPSLQEFIQREIFSAEF